MWRSKKFLFSALLAVVLLGGTIGGIALAQEGDDTTTVSLIARVAEKLGIDEDTLEQAIDEAQQEMQGEAMSSRLEALVEEGVLTQEEADEYGAWWQAKPDAFGKFGLGGRDVFGGLHGMRGRITFHGWGGPCFGEDD